ncbi:unnamed protein product [Medioppia subpectinata]|uniref:AMP-binding enzyme C-terminal domain-containing protein n=1 Tax=Medioppia subpectinata TaxID=1979941 RepID=A0A7R9KX36_9ACAR|nr:unnamed protein product [Medioppia subpectinata]CAG2111441.1 unnamed protein product [Medioppia subpectinata]
MKMCMTKCNVVQIDPDELAKFLMSHKAVDDAVVVGINNRIGLHWLRAYVVIKQENNPGYKHLEGGVEFVDCIHTTIIGNSVRKYYRNIVNSDLSVIFEKFG